MFSNHSEPDTQTTTFAATPEFFNPKIKQQVTAPEPRGCVHKVKRFGPRNNCYKPVLFAGHGELNGNKAAGRCVTQNLV